MLWVKSTGCIRFGDYTETGTGDSAGQGFGGLFAPEVRDPWRGRGVYDTCDGGLSLASFRSVSKISMPTTTAGSPRVETVVTGETRQCFEHGMERMLRSRQEISEMKERLGIIPHMYRTLASNQRRYLQLVRAFMKRDMVNLIEADEVRERVGVFWLEKPGQNTQRLIIDARVSNLHCLPLPGVSLVTSEGLSRVEVALEHDDVDPGELSRLASLHLGVADVGSAFHRFKISKLYSSFLKWKAEKWPFWLDACAPVLAACRWVTRSLFSVRKQSKRQCGPQPVLVKQEFSRTQGAAWFRASLSRAMVQSLHVVPHRNSSMCLSIISVSW